MLDGIEYVVAFWLIVFASIAIGIGVLIGKYLL